MMIIGVIIRPLESSSAEWGLMEDTFWLPRLLLFPAEFDAEEFLNAANRPFLSCLRCFRNCKDSPISSAASCRAMADFVFVLILGGDAPKCRAMTDFVMIFSPFFQIYYYMPSAVNASTMDRNGKPSMIMIPAKSYEQPSLAYIDLDLPKDDEVFTPPSRSTAALKKAREEESSTIYKTVDFEMTKAFNQTRKDVEEKRLHTTEQRN